MAEIIWSPESLTDLDAIAEFIARDSVARAALFIERLIEAFERLNGFPLSGRIIPEVGRKDCRELIYGSHRVLYRITENDVWIVAVVHSARKWRLEF